MGKTEGRVNVTGEEWLKQDDFTLVLSSGYFGFYAHCGFVQALAERGIRPAQLAGCSAGALIAGSLASGNSPEEIKERIFALKREDFWDPGLGFGILKGRKFDQILREFLRPRIEDCMLPLQVVVWDVFRFKTATLKKGDLTTAVRASCAVPGMFHPVKHSGRYYLDGGIFDKIALTGIDRQPRVFCHYLYSAQESSRVPGTSWPREMRKLVLSENPDWRGLVIKDLTRVNPNKLENGPRAWQEAYQSTSGWLDKKFDEKISQTRPHTKPR